VEAAVARAGVYLSDVKRARDELIAQGRRPSIDAVRAALGHTGSKTTIHKYLRELEAEEGDAAQSVSDAILRVVTQLADELKQEAATELEVLRHEMAAERAAWDDQRATLEARLAETGQSLSEVSQQLEVSQRDFALLKEQLAAEKNARCMAEQHNDDLHARLADAERHQASLEEKHKHARDALDHYRTAAKEQREQEGRRHDQQVQGLQAELRQSQLAVSVKQEELTRLNKEAAALAAELASAKQGLYIEREASRNHIKRIEQLQAVQARAAVLELQLAESRAHATEVEQAAARSANLCDELRQQINVLEVELARAKNAAALEERLAKLDKAVFGAGETGPSGR
jgi:chromosome segregation ATPase